MHARPPARKQPSGDDERMQGSYQYLHCNVEPCLFHYSSIYLMEKEIVID